VGNPAAFADGSIIASQCQMGMGLVEAALETLDAGHQVLIEKGYDDLALVVAAQKREIMLDREMEIPPDDIAANDPAEEFADEPDEPVEEEPVTEEPTAEEPIAEEPVAEEPPPDE
jgi:hypothetical protein